MNLEKNQFVYTRLWKDRVNLVLNFIHLSVIYIAIIHIFNNLLTAIISLLFALLLLGIMLYLYLKKNPYHRFSEFPLLLCGWISTIAIFVYISYFNLIYYLLIIGIIFVIFEIGILIFFMLTIPMTHYQRLRHAFIRPHPYIFFANNRKFAQFDKGRQYWQDRSPEDLELIKKAIKQFEKKYKRTLVLSLNIICVIGYLLGITIGFSIRTF
jgi:hypothetical protein